MLALMRLLTSVSTDVYSQGASLNEALPTSRCHTRIWTFICVDSIMSLKIRFAIEALCDIVSEEHGAYMCLVLY